MRSVVVLPQPDGPSSEKNSPAAMSSVTRSTATTLPSKVLVTSSSRMAAEVSAQLFRIFGDARVDVVLALVVPFPVGLDQRGDLGFGGESLSSYLASSFTFLLAGEYHTASASSFCMSGRSM